MLCGKNIKVSSGNDYFPFFGSNEIDGIKEAQERLLKDIEHTRILGSNKLIWYTGANEKFSGEASVNELILRLEPVLERAKELDVTLLLETEFSEGTDPAASVKLLKSIMTKADTPHLAINFDAANMYVAGQEPFPYGYEELKPWIKYVHLKDVRALIDGVYSEKDMKGRLQAGTKRCACCSLGEGAVNTSGILKALKADGYNGYLSLELHMKEQYQDETLAKSLEYLKKYWGKGM